MDNNANAINWFEISVGDIARATKFYEAVFETTLIPMEMMGLKMAMFPIANMSGKVGGSLVESPMHKPSMDGAKVYMNGNPDLATALGKVEAAGGKVTMPKTIISEDSGYMAFFIDSEGNSVGLHSTK